MKPQDQGPWEVDDVYYTDVQTEEGLTICSCDNPADAPLIAAAPDLLAALKALLAAPNEIGLDQAAARTRALAAIEKAAGTP